MLTAGSSGFPTPERKPEEPARASAFQGCSNYFEPLKRHLAVGRSQQKSVGDGLEKKPLALWLHPVREILSLEGKFR